MPKLRIVGSGPAPVDEELVAWADAFADNVRAGRITGAVIVMDTGDALDFDFCGEFEAYALAKYAERRLDALLDEMECDGEIN